MGFTLQDLSGDEMAVANFDQFVEYVTNTDGDCVGVFVPIAVWEEFKRGWQALVNAQMDDDEPNEILPTELKESIRQATAGETLPLSELWTDLDHE